MEVCPVLGCLCVGKILAKQAGSVAVASVARATAGLGLNVYGRQSHGLVHITQRAAPLVRDESALDPPLTLWERGMAVLRPNATNHGVLF